MRKTAVIVISVLIIGLLSGVRYKYAFADELTLKTLLPPRPWVYSTDAGHENDIYYNDGNVGIGTATPMNKLDVEGGVAIGAGYSGTKTAPSNGMIVQGKVGVGVDAPVRSLHISDVMRLQPRASAPAAASSGDIYVGTDNHIYCYLGGSWKQLDN